MEVQVVVSFNGQKYPRELSLHESSNTLGDQFFQVADDKLKLVFTTHHGEKYGSVTLPGSIVHEAMANAAEENGQNDPEESPVFENW